MIYQYPKYKNPPNNSLGILVGMVIGTLAGAGAMLLLAKRSGKETRTQIEKKAWELRGRTTEMVEDTMVQVRLNPDKITMGAENYEQLEHVSNAA